MRKIILAIIVIFSSLIPLQAQEIIFEELGDALRFDGRILRANTKEKIICLKQNDSLVIFNITKKRLKKKSIYEIDSLIISGRVISDSPLIGIFNRKNPLNNIFVNDIFVMEKDNRIVKLDLPLRNYGLWYNKKDSIIEIISGNYTALIRYTINISKMEVMILDTLDVDGKGYYYIFGGESNQIERGEKILLFNYPYLTGTKVLIIKVKNDGNIEKIERNDNAFLVGVIGIRKYSMGAAEFNGTVVFDIYDQTYKKFIDGENDIITGTDELLIKVKWGYRTPILNINGEVVDYLVYKYYWSVLDAVMMGDSLIIVGMYKLEETGTIYGIVVMKKKLLTPISVVESESKNKNEREKIKVEKVGSNTFEISNLEENDRIVLYDILGRKVKEVEGSSRIILNNVSSGVYFLVVKRRDYIVFREKVYIVK